MFGRGALLTTAGLIVLAGLILGAFPMLDLGLADIFEDSDPSFILRLSPLANLVRSLGLVLPAGVALAFGAVLLLKLVWPRFQLFADSRGLVGVLIVFALAPGLLVNGVLKETWGRERPIRAVAQFEKGDRAAFGPWWNPYGRCRHNCSFASGEVAGATVLIAAASVLPTAVAGPATVLALAFTVVIGLLRLAFGGHFLSDVLLGALFTHFIAILVLRTMHDPRWAPGRAGAIERWLARRSPLGGTS